MRSCRDNTVALGIVLGLACASVPFAALAENFFPGLFNPYGAQRPAPTHAARVRQGAPYGAQPQAPTYAAPAWQQGTQPQARSFAARVRRGARYGTQPQAPSFGAPAWQQGTQPQAASFAAPAWQGMQPQAPSFAAPVWQGMQPQAPIFAAPAQQPASVHAHRHRVVHPASHPEEEAQAWCVRGCDGRYFPISGPDDKSRAENCSNFCPASQTLLVHGNDIDDAVTDRGKPYSELPNAFRYRNELVAGCTCNGKDKIGLAQVAIDNDQTLRKGDIVAAADGLEVARRDADARGGAKLSPLSRSVQARFRHLPVVASGR